MVVVALWRFPEEDFPLWLQHCAEEDDFKTYAEYLANIELIAMECRNHGDKVYWVRWGVQRVMDTLKREGKPNSSANRADLFARIPQSVEKLRKAIRGKGPRLDH